MSRVMVFVEGCGSCYVLLRGTEIGPADDRRSWEVRLLGIFVAHGVLQYSCVARHNGEARGLLSIYFTQHCTRSILLLPRRKYVYTHDIPTLVGSRQG